MRTTEYLDIRVIQTRRQVAIETLVSLTEHSLTRNNKFISEDTLSVPSPYILKNLSNHTISSWHPNADPSYAI